MKPLICPNCGGKIDRSRMRCEYCGTEFKSEHDDLLRIECVRPGVKELKVGVVFSDEFIRYADPECLKNAAIGEMTKKLAEALAPMMDIVIEEDCFRMQTFVRGRIRVVEPGRY